MAPLIEFHHPGQAWFTCSPSRRDARNHASLAFVPRCLEAAMVLTVPGVSQRAVVEIDQVVRGVDFPLDVENFMKSEADQKPGKKTWEMNWGETVWCFSVDEAVQSLTLKYQDCTLVFGQCKDLGTSSPMTVPLDAYGGTLTAESSSWMEKLSEPVRRAIENEQKRAQVLPGQSLSGVDLPPIFWEGETPEKIKDAIRSITESLRTPHGRKCAFSSTAVAVRSAEVYQNCNCPAITEVDTGAGYSTFFSKFVKTKFECPPTEMIPPREPEPEPDLWEEYLTQKTKGWPRKKKCYYNTDSSEEEEAGV